MNKVELVLNEEKIREHNFDSASVHEAVDDVFLRNGLVKEGNFFIEKNPVDPWGDSMTCMWVLSQRKWFRDTVEVFKWYTDYCGAIKEGFHVEDGMKEFVQRYQLEYNN